MIQYTIRGITEHMDRTLRRTAAQQGKSLNAVVLDSLTRYHDLDDLAGTWIHDPEFDRAIAATDVIDDDLWQ